MGPEGTPGSLVVGQFTDPEGHLIGVAGDGVARALQPTAPAVGRTRASPAAPGGLSLRTRTSGPPRLGGRSRIHGKGALPSGAASVQRPFQFSAPVQGPSYSCVLAFPPVASSPSARGGVVRRPSRARRRRALPAGGRRFAQPTIRRL